MVATVVEVVKVVAPIALEALAKAAIKLVSGTAPQAVVAMTSANPSGPEAWGESIDSNTDAPQAPEFNPGRCRYPYG